MAWRPLFRVRTVPALNRNRHDTSLPQGFQEVLS